MAHPQNKSEIKQENSGLGGSPASFADSEIDDAGDLEFNDDQRFKNAYLARVPKYVWEQWDKMGDDEEIVLGTLRQSWTFDANSNRQESVCRSCNLVSAANNCLAFHASQCRCARAQRNTERV